VRSSSWAQQDVLDLVSLLLEPLDTDHGVNVDLSALECTLLAKPEMYARYNEGRLRVRQTPTNCKSRVKEYPAQ